MHQLWMAYADDPTDQHLADDTDLVGRAPRQTFDAGRQVGACNGREVKWMLLIDPTTEQGKLVASYGVSPFTLIGEPSFAADEATEWYPAAGPKQK